MSFLNKMLQNDFQFDLVCDRTWLVSFSSTLLTLGYLFGALTCGILSDR